MNDESPIHQFYFKTQPHYSALDISSTGDLFVKIPELSIAFHHQRPLLCRIDYRGSLYTPVAGHHTFHRIMIDNKILHSNKLIPNSPERGNAISPSTSNLYLVDAFAGSVFWAAVSLDLGVSNSEVVYLKPGTHTIDVAVRTARRAIFQSGELRIELIELQSKTNINLPFLS
ncbi:unnamed protein product [Rotaria magnacalcarata]|uniref:Uncharacterized protein n=1 Tax=Rotaria magnacalcarata TaxID=392030 RepID=A0A816CMX8_9BILA|nr:unnamed protein product [Rotaria magnacalcarata]CAF1622414.1 unnamed protein product [Rotaria magnacalcarata]CAF2048779.1 unnamed protein product [Rotaria magnacalcarata]CAF5146221.1 unnamed protein product [Rotaria magnacalcarata]CAF5216415.1 unnamed protein product [Rotaria magnacalcarata]